MKLPLCRSSGNDTDVGGSKIYEGKRHFQEIPIGFNGELMQFLEVNSASLYTHKQNYPPEDYGSRWRCWLEKPTVKEMEMALWEE